MKKGIIIYQSKYGATQKYAGWLREMTGFDYIRAKDALPDKVKKYEVIVLCGGIYASSIAGLSFLKKNIGRLGNKKTIAKRDPSTYEPWMVGLMSAVGQTGDWTDKKYLAPLMEYLRDL